MSEEEIKSASTTAPRSTPIGEVKLTEESWIKVSTFDGRDGRKRVDIRLFLSGPKYTGPTKRGVSIPVDQLGALKKLLDQVS